MRTHAVYFPLLVVLALVATALGPANLAPALSAPRLQPILAQAAAVSPGQLVSVIVQKADQTPQAEQSAVRLGGTITKDLHIIHAFAAEMTAAAARELAASPAVRWVSLDAPMQSSGSDKFTTWSTKFGTVVTNGFTNAKNILSTMGRDGTYGYGGRVQGSFGGFQPEYSPGTAITKVEVLLRLYVPSTLASTETPKLTAYVNNLAGATVSVPASTLNACLGAWAACTLHQDVTG